MKNIIKYTLIISSVIFSSCSDDFLEKTPESAITTGNFYQTKDQFNQALSGTYAAIRNAEGSSAAWVIGETRSDNTFYEYNVNLRGSGVVSRESIDGFLDDNNDVNVSSFYNASYVTISRANNILAYINDAGLDEATVNTFIGQAKFIRALSYFDLVRYFGGVSLYLDAVETEQQAFLPRSTVAEVYDVIESDLKDAFEKLDNTSFPQTGKISKGAGHMLLGDVYLTRKKYALAEQEFLSVTQSGYELLPEYASVYQLTNKNSKESIFELQYQQGNQGQQSDFLYPFLPLSANVKILTGITSTNITTGGWNVPTQEFISSYETGDKRLDASIGIGEGTGDIGNMIIESEKSIVNYTTPVGKRYYAFIKKYRHPHSLVNNTDDNFPVYRYSEALLSLAEVLNEQDKRSEAIAYLNQVRVRAGLNSTNELDKDKLREIIAHERRVELAFENKRWLDLVRTGKAIEVLTKNGVYLKALNPHLLPQSYTVTENRLIYAIPLRETIIGKLEQNPGY